MNIDINKLPRIDEPVKGSSIDVSRLPKIEADTPNPNYNPVAKYTGNVMGDVSAYQPYFEGLVPMYFSQEALDETRAHNQTAGQLWKGVLDQVVVGELIGGTISAAGTLAKITGLPRLIASTDNVWQENAMQEWGRQITEGSQARSPIYQTKRAQEGFALTDRTWWASSAPSLASTVAMMIPAGAASSLTMKLLKGISQTATMRKAVGTIKAFDKTKNIKEAFDIAGTIKDAERGAGLMGKSAEFWGKTLTASIYSRHIDNYQSAMESYTTLNEKYKELGFTEEESHLAASKAATMSYRLGYLNLWSDMLSWGVLFKYGDFANRGINAKVAAAVHKRKFRGMDIFGEKAMENISKLMTDAKITAGSVAKDLLVESFSEGAEEVSIGLISKEVERAADIDMGLKRDINDGSFGNRVAKHLVDPHTWDEFFWGAVGGLIFGGAGLAKEAISNKNNIAAANKQADNIIAHVTDLATSYNEYVKAMEAGNTAEGSTILIKQQEAILQNSLMNGTIGLDVEVLRNIGSLTNEQLNQIGFAPDTQEDVKKFADRLEQAGKTYNKYAKLDLGYGEYDSAIAIELARGEYAINKYNEYIDEYKAEKAKTEFLIDEVATKYGAPAAQTLQAKQYISLQEQSKAIHERARGNVTNELRMLESLTPHVKAEEQVAHYFKINKLKNVIATYDNAINEAEKSITELKQVVEDFKPVINELENKDEINDFITQNIKSNDKIYDVAIGVLTANKEYQEAQVKRLATDEGKKELVDNIKQVEKLVKNERRNDFKRKAESATNDEELENLNKEYNNEFEDIYNDNKSRIKIATEKTAFNERLNNIANLVKSRTINTPEDIAFYEENKNVIDKLVDQLYKAEDKTNVVTNIKTDLLNTINDVFLGYFKDAEKRLAVNAVNDLITDDGKLNELSGVPDVKLYSAYSLALALNSASKVELTPDVKAVFDNIFINKVNLLKQLFADEYFDELGDYNKSNTVPVDKLGSFNAFKKADLAISYLYVFNTAFDNYAKKYNIGVNQGNTEVNADIANNSPELNTLISKIEGIGEKAKGLFDNDGNALESQDLSNEVSNEMAKAMTEPIILAQSLAEALGTYYSNTDKEVNITLETVYDLLIKGNRADVFNKYWYIYRNLFEALDKLYNGKLELESNKLIKFDFKVTTPNIRNSKFPEIYLAKHISIIPPYDKNRGAHVYLRGLIEKDYSGLTDDETVERIKAFQELQVNDELDFLIRNDYVDSRFDEATNKERNNNPDLVPIEIKNKDGILIGYIRTLEFVEEGLPYINENNEFVPFSKIVNDKDVDLIVNNINELYDIYSDAFKGKIKKSKITEVNTLIDKLTKHNRSTDSEVTANQIKHVLAPIFYNVKSDNINTLNRAKIKTKYENHFNAFLNDYQRSKEIRNAIATNKNIQLRVGAKSMTPGITNLKSFNKPVSTNIAPSNVDGVSRINIAHTSLDGTGDFIDIRTGKIIKIDNTIDTSKNKAVSIHEVTPGRYQGFLLDRAKLTGEEGTAIINLIIKQFNDVIANPTTQQINKAKEIIKPFVELTADNSTNKDSFNFKFNKFKNNKGDIEPSITFKSVTKDGTVTYYEAKFINNKIRIYEGDITESGSIAAKGKEHYVEYEIGEATRVLGKLLKNVRRGAIIVDGKMQIDKTGGKFYSATGKEYDNYADYIIDTDGYVTNLNSVRDNNGNVITNFIPSTPNEKNRGNFTLNITHTIQEDNLKSIRENVIRKGGKNLTEVEQQVYDNEIDYFTKLFAIAEEVEKQEVDELAELTKYNEQATDYLGKTVIELLDNPLFKEYALLKDILISLGLTNLVIDNQVIRGSTSKSEASVIDNTIRLHEAFFVKKGVVVSKGEQVSILVHEFIHPIIDAAINKLDDTQRNELISNLAKFRESLKSHLNSDLLTDAEKRILSIYLDRAENQHFSETITYALTNPNIAAILAKLPSEEGATHGFWSMLKDIIIKLLNTTTGGKLNELVNLLDKMVNIEEITTTNKDTKIVEETKEITTKRRTFKPKDNLGNILKSESFDDVYDNNTDNIINRYGLTKEQFNYYWSQLSDAEKQQEIKCL
ncbi:hypothetical protein DSECCO2_119980 [anaerobic digester metagenome]